MKIKRKREDEDVVRQINEKNKKERKRNKPTDQDKT
jgi:hypothetical protein